MTWWRKLTSAFVSAVLVVGLCPSMAFAQGGALQLADTDLAAQDEDVSDGEGSSQSLELEDGLYALPNMEVPSGSMFNHMIPGSRYLKVEGDNATIMFVQDGSTASVSKYSRIALGKSSELVKTAYQPDLPEGVVIVEGVNAGTGTSGTKWGFEIPMKKSDVASMLNDESPLYITIWNNQGASTNGYVPGWYKASTDQYITLGALGEKVSAEAVSYDLTPANTEKMFVVVKVVLEDYPGTHDYLTYYLNSDSYNYAFSGGQDDAVASWDFDKGTPKADDARWAAKASEEIDFAYTTWNGEAKSDKASKAGYRIPVTVPEGETQFSLPVVAYASDFTARSFQMDLVEKTVVPGSASDVASLNVSSSVADVAAADTGSVSYTGYVRPYAGNQDTSKNPLSNDFVGKLALNLGGNGVYDQAYAVTYQGTPYVKADAEVSEPLDSDYATVGEDGGLELPFYNEYDSTPKTVQLDGNKITVKMHVAESAPYKEAGTWVERTFQLDFSSRTAGTLAISGEPLTAAPKQPVEQPVVTKKKVAVPSAVNATYDGKEKTGVAASDDYTLSGTAKATDANTYTVKATLKDTASTEWADGTVAPKDITWTIGKANNTLKVKAAKSKLSAKSKKKTTFAAKNAFKVSKNVSKGALTYKKTSGNKKITVTKAGKVTVKKGLKKGTYTVKVKVTSKVTKNYKSADATVTLKVKVS